MTLSFHNGKVVLHAGDCMDVLRELPANSIDAVVTDPPYHLTSIVKRFGGANAAPAKGNEAFIRASRGFMGKRWDGGDIAFTPELWAEVLRVLKPGGHMVCFGGTRTYHRMACAIEDAGFEIREMLSWNFGSGFPKSHNIGKHLDASQKRCTCDSRMRDLRNDLDSEDALSSGEEQDVRPNMLGSVDWKNEQRAEGLSVNAVRDLREADSQAALAGEEGGTGVLQPLMPQQDLCRPAAAFCGERLRKTAAGNGDAGPDESGVEGRGDVPQEARELRVRPIRPLPSASSINGESGRICNGAPEGDGRVDRPTSGADGVCSSQRPQAAQQSSDQSGTVARQPESQERRAWDHCERCGKPIVPDGLGTALKPAHEPICLARKPLSEGTVASNVLRWGTGAINVDGCRVATDESTRRPMGKLTSKGLPGGGFGAPERRGNRPIVGIGGGSESGRFPANLIHDGSPEVLAGFPETTSGNFAQRGLCAGTKQPGGWETGARTDRDYNGDSGSAARFFYTAKADADDRLGSKHPTVKPVDLMQWLVRLVCPKGGVCLDPFAGTGTTGAAAFIEGCRAVLIEREAEYLADIERRMGLLLSGPDERARKLAKPDPHESLPLFGGRPGKNRTVIARGEGCQ